MCLYVPIRFRASCSGMCSAVLGFVVAEGRAFVKCYSKDSPGVCYFDKGFCGEGSETALRECGERGSPTSTK